MTFEVHVAGLLELRAALDEVVGKVDAALGKALTAAAVPIRQDVRDRAQGYSARTVAGVRIRRKGTTVRVEQGQRKTTGMRPTFGPFQQRNFFDPALADHQAEAVAAVQAVMDEMAAIVNETP